MDRQKRIDRLIAIIYFGALLGIAYFCYKYLLPAFLPFLIAILISCQLRKIAGFFMKHSGVRGRIAAAASVLTFYAAVIFLMWVAGAYSISYLMRIFKYLPDLYTNSIGPGLSVLETRLRDIIEGISPEFAGDIGGFFDIAMSSIRDFIGKFSASAMDYLGSIITKLPTMILGVIFTVILTFLITADYQNITTFLMRQVPREFRDMVADIKKFLSTTIRRLLKAYFIIMIMTFGMLSVGLYFLRIEGFLKIAALIAIFDILPILGSIMIFLPWSAYCFITGNIPLGFGLLFLFALMETVRNFMEPHIIGEQIGLHPVATIISFFVGLKLMGVGGIIIAPILALTAKHLHEKKYIRLFK